MYTHRYTYPGFEGFCQPGWNGGKGVYDMGVYIYI